MIHQPHRSSGLTVSTTESTFSKTEFFMRVSFPNATTHTFWVLPVQALAPWINRIRNTLWQPAVLPTKRQLVDTVPPSFSTATATATATASNDSVFENFLEATPLPCRPALKTSNRNVLRVVRESDSAISADCAGRMVISGRMIDVCAELDRMADVVAVTEA